MNEEHKNLIVNKLPELIEVTLCTGPFLARLKARHVLSKYESQAIEAEKVHMDKSRIFYDIIVTRTNGFEQLTDALIKTQQSGVLKILGQSNDISKKPRNIPIFINKPPSYVTTFLNQDIKTILLVSSHNCPITCDRISETVPTCKYLDGDEFLYLISTTSSPDYIPVFNCKADWELALSQISELEGKCILVTSEELSEEKLNSSSSNSAKGCMHYLLHTKENIKWKDLTPIYGVKILNQLGSTLGMPTTDINNALQTMDTGTLIDLINGQQPKLLQDNLPGPLSYYVSRHIIPRHVVTRAIFDSQSDDIYLFKGIQRHVLSEMTNGQGTDTTSNILSRSGYSFCKFLLLDHEDHFYEIAERHKGYSVHVLHFQSDLIMIWEKSIGTVVGIRKSIEMEETQAQTKIKYTLSEEEFLNQITCLKEKSRYPICISDSPGMGKSVLLAHFARGLRGKIGQKGGIGFVIMSEFIEDIKKELGELQTATNEVVTFALTKYLSSNVLGQVYLERNRNFLEELFFDGFDELSSDDMELGYQCFEKIRSSFGNSRLWVTTRPHMLEELENSLGVLGYNIRAFEEEDQLNFLTTFWSTNISTPKISLDSEKLTRFARRCLATLKSTINTAEQDIAGIPLQCLLIGEVYEKEAIQFSNICQKFTHEDLTPTLRIDSMMDLYRELVAKKFRNFQYRYNKKGLEISQLLNLHTYMAMRLLCPNFLSQSFQQRLRPDDFPLKDLCNAGILESKTIPLTPRFIHRTFAEYFLAHFVIQLIAQEREEDVINLIFGHIFKTQSTKFQNSGYVIPTWEFQHNVTCYFIDSLLAKIERKPHVGSLLDQYGVYTLTDATEACVYNNFQNLLLHFLYDIVTKSAHKDKVFTDKLLVIATFRSGLSMVKTVFEIFESCKEGTFKWTKETELTLLQVSARRGDFNVVEWLLAKENFKTLLHEANMIHVCVADSRGHDERILREKKSVIRYIVGINQRLLLQEKKKILPIESERIHVDLANELISCAGSMYKDNGLLSRILHNLTKTLNDDEYLGVLRTILEHFDQNSIKGLLQSTWNDTQLGDAIVTAMEPGKELLELFSMHDMNLSLIRGITFQKLQTFIQNVDEEKCKEEADLRFKQVPSNNVHATDEKGNTVLHLAAYRGTPNIIECAFRYCSNVENCNKINETPLHILARSNNFMIKSWKFLMDNHANPVALDSQNISPIYYLWCHQTVDTASQAILYCTKIEKCIEMFSLPHALDKNQNTLLHYAAKMGNIRLLEIAYLLAPNINVLNDNNSTCLHLVAQSPNFEMECWKFLIDHHADLLSKNNEKRTPLADLLCTQQPQICQQAILHCMTAEKWKSIIAGEHDLDEDGNSFLHLASDKGDIELLKMAICHAQNINALSNDNRTCLHFLAASGNFSVECWKFLIDNHADLLARDKGGITPLALLMIQNAQITKEIISYCLEVGKFKTIFSSCQELDQHGNSLLHRAAWTGNLNLLEFVFLHSPHIHAVNNNKSTCMHLLAESENFSMECWKFLIHENADILAKDDKKLSPLYVLIVEQPAQTCKEAISYCFQVDKWRDILSRKHELDDDGHSLLHFAGWKGNVKLLEFVFGLCHHDVNALTNHKSTPLHVLAQSKHFSIECWKYLIGKNADMFAKNSRNNTPLAEIFSVQSLDICEEAIKYIPPNVEKWDQDLDGHGNSLLHLAAWKGNLKLLESAFLRSHNVTAVNKNKSTCMHLLAKCNNFSLSCWKFLIDNAAADPFAKDSQRRTPLYGLLLEQHADICKEAISYCTKLEKWEAVLSKQQDLDEDGNSLVHLAAWKGNVMLLEFVFNQHPNINAVNDNNGTCLHLVAESKNFSLECWEFLVNKNANNVIAKDKNNFTPLYAMLYAQNADICEKAILYCTQLENWQSVVEQGLDGKGNSLLHFAAWKGSVKLLELIASSPHSSNMINIANNNNNTCMYSLAESDNFSIDCWKFLADHNANILAKNKDAFTPLYALLYTQPAEICMDAIIHVLKDEKWKNVLERDQDIDGNGNGLLHIAAWKGHLKLLESVFRHSSSPNINHVNNIKRTCLHLLAFSNNFTLECWKFLVDKEANPLAFDNDGDTPLSDLIRHQCAETGVHAISYCATRGIYPEMFTRAVALDSDGNTLLHLAAEKGDKTLLEFVVSHNRDINTINKHMETCLHSLARSANFSIDCWKFLVGNKANSQRLNDNKDTPLDVLLRHQDAITCRQVQCNNS